VEIGTKPYVSLRHPRLLRFRADKTVNPKDLRQTQIPNGKPLTYTLYQGDCRKILPTLKSETIDLIVTSPPYYKVKEYGGIEGEIGVKGNVEQYENDLLEVLDECHRLLTPTGVLALNLDRGGDSAFGVSFPK
jgi:DNA modification methylase